LTRALSLPIIHPEIGDASPGHQPSPGIGNATLTQANHDMGASESRATAEPQGCAVRTVTHGQEVIDNVPYLLLIVLGAAVVSCGPADGPWRWLAAGLYATYGVAGAIWIICFVCPHCGFYDTRLCPCGYGQVAPWFRKRAANSDFARQFRKHIPVIVPLWFIPLIAGGISLVRDFSWGVLVMLFAFALNSFVVLPLVSRKYGCSACPQKGTCPWMGNCKA